MSSQAIIHPAEVNRFAGNLQRYRDELESATASLEADFANLGDTWRDVEHEHFEREFIETVKVIRHFIRVADEHVPFLHRKARRAQEYLDQK